MSHITFNLATPAGLATQVRATMTVIVDALAADGFVLDDAGMHLLVGGGFQPDDLQLHGTRFPMVAGENSISFTLPIQHQDAIEEAEILVDFLADYAAALASCWAQIDVSQLDVFVEPLSYTRDTTALSMTPLIQSEGNGTSGGCRIVKAGDLAAATTIEITGYYDFDATPLEGLTALYLPRWETGATFTPVTPAAIPLLFSGPDWGWVGSEEPVPFPEYRSYLCKVKVDGGSEVFALLHNDAGV